MTKTRNTSNVSAIQRQLVVFVLNGQKYALSIDNIKEVVLTSEISEMPKALDYVVGVTNIRGTVYVVVDLEEKFKIKDPSDDTLAKYIVLVESGKNKFGILVNEVPNTLTISEEDIDRSRDIIAATDVADTYVEGIVKNGQEMIILIDAVAMLTKDAAAKL